MGWMLLALSRSRIYEQVYEDQAPDVSIEREISQTTIVSSVLG